jgi:thiamine pyrophosphokinase
MNLNILAGGPIDNVDFNFLKQQEGDWVGVDEGTVNLINNDIIPMLSVGDYDSISKQQLLAIREKLGEDNVIISTPIKDDTDTELALLNVDLSKYELINIFGATGGRLDHELSNFQIPTQDRFIQYLTKFRIIDRDNLISFLPEGENSVDFDIDFNPYISFMIIDSAKDFEIKNAKYNLSKLDIKKTTTYASNEFIDKQPILINFTSGVVMVIRSKK